MPAALSHLDLAEQRFRALGSRLGFILADRSELLLSVRLFSEARQTGEQAVRQIEREGQQIVLPEARLILARAAALDGDSAYAVGQARRAVSEFARQQRPHWTALARFVLLSSRPQRGRPAAGHRAAVRAGRGRPDDHGLGRRGTGSPAAGRPACPRPRQAGRGRPAPGAGQPGPQAGTSSAAKPRMVRRGPDAAGERKHSRCRRRGPQRAACPGREPGHPGRDRPAGLRSRTPERTGRPGPAYRDRQRARRPCPDVGGRGPRPSSAVTAGPPAGRSRTRGRTGPPPGHRRRVGGTAACGPPQRRPGRPPGRARTPDP